MSIEFQQRISRIDYVRLALRRWPWLWARKDFGYAPAWWLRLLSLPFTTFKALSLKASFPIEQQLSFDERGVRIGSSHGTRNVAWSEFREFTDLSSAWVLIAPGFDLALISRRLAPPLRKELHDLIQRHVAPSAPLKH